MKLFVNILLSLLLLISIKSNGQINIHGSIKTANVGIEGVVVSSGCQFTKTDLNGNFSLSISDGDQFVQISCPFGYSVPVVNSVPQFYKEIDTKVNKSYDFEITRKTKNDENHMLIVQTDVQVANESDLEQYNSYIIPDIKNTLLNYKNKEIVGLDLGDIVGDNPKLFAPYKGIVNQLNIPFYRLIGNHDMAYWGRSHETSEKHFNKHFGPTTYSFNIGKTHYIALNNNFFIGRDYFYIGYIDEKTFKWIEKDLQYVPKGSTVFLLAHIPIQLQTSAQSFAYNYSTMAGATINASSLHKLLEGYNVHILSGHTHQTNNVSFGEKLFEHNIAASSGSWWEFDVCTDGTPRGYAVFEIDSDEVKWYYKSAGKDRDYQFRLSKTDSHNFIVNVWNYDPSWKVEWFEDGNYMGQLEPFEGHDPYVVDLIKNKANLRYSWISSTPTKNLFKGKVKNANAEIKVQVTDRFGNIYEQLINDL